MIDDKPTAVCWPVNLPGSGLMTVAQTAKYLGMSRTEFYRRRKEGKTPPESSVVENRWLLNDVNKWLGKSA